jgi:hypothetical protein
VVRVFGDCANLDSDVTGANTLSNRKQSSLVGIPALPPNPEVDAAGRLRPITSGSELSDDDEQDLLNQNLPRSELKRVKRYVRRETRFGLWKVNPWK